MQDGKQVILCIDDDPDICTFLKTVLDANGYVASTACSGEEGLKIYKEISPDLVIVDLMMEEIDSGTTLMKEFRAAGCTVPVYMLSSAGDALTLSTDYTQLGFSGVLQKPLDPDRLVGILETKLA